MRGLFGLICVPLRQLLLAHRLPPTAGLSHHNRANKESHRNIHPAMKPISIALLGISVLGWLGSTKAYTVMTVGTWWLAL